VHGLHSLLVVLLVLDAVQAAAAVAALVQARSRRARGEHVLARYSVRHAWLLLAGAAVLGVPIVLGLTGALSARTAAWVVVGAEVVGWLLARAVLERLHAAAHG
jgi:hypothetical protein